MEVSRRWGWVGVGLLIKPHSGIVSRQKERLCVSFMYSLQSQSLLRSISDFGEPDIQFNVSLAEPSSSSSIVQCSIRVVVVEEQSRALKAWHGQLDLLVTVESWPGEVCATPIPVDYYRFGQLLGFIWRGELKQVKWNELWRNKLKRWCKCGLSVNFSMNLFFTWMFYWNHYSMIIVWLSGFVQENLFWFGQKSFL